MYRMDKEFRETVVRQALLLGFEAAERGIYTDEAKGVPTRVYFVHNGVKYDGYASVFSAALEYLRLINFPEEKIGKLNEPGG